MSYPDHAPRYFTLDTGDTEFARGLEIGTLWGVLAYQRDKSVTKVVRRDNVENVLRVVTALGRKFHTTDECSNGCHFEFHFEPATADHQ